MYETCMKEQGKWEEIGVCITFAENCVCFCSPAYSSGARAGSALGLCCFSRFPHWTNSEKPNSRGKYFLKYSTPSPPEKKETAFVQLQSPHCMWFSAHPPHGSLQGLSSHKQPVCFLPQVILTWCESLLFLAVEVAVGRDHHRNNGDLERKQSTVSETTNFSVPHPKGKWCFQMNHVLCW